MLRAARRIERAARRLAGIGNLRFLHIGKTGGSAVRHVLGDWSACSKRKIILHWHNLRFTEVPAGDQTIFFLRDPVKRFVSSFYSRQRQGRPKYDNPWTEDEQLAFSRFGTANELALALSSEDAVVKSNAEMAMGRIQHVNRPYGWWFADEASFLSRTDRLFFIGFQEQLADDFDRLKRMLGIPAAACLPEDEVLSHRAPEGTDRWLEPQAERNLQRWYAADIRFVELCRELIEKHPRLAGR
jgi:hypothetical protein